MTPHSRQCAAGAVLAALRATFGCVTKEGAAAAGKRGVSSISAWVPPSWPTQGEQQLFFWLFAAQDVPTERGWKCWKVLCYGVETQAAATGILGNTLPKELELRWRPCSIWGGAGWGSCPIKSKPETLQFNWELLPGVLSFKRIFGKGGKHFTAVKCQRSPFPTNPTLVCVYYWNFLCRTGPTLCSVTIPTEQTLSHILLGCPRAAQTLPAWIQTSCSRVSSSRDTILGHFLQNLYREWGREGGKKHKKTGWLFHFPEFSPGFSENTKIALTNSSFCQPNIWYLKKNTVPVKCDISAAFCYEVLSLTNLPEHTPEMWKVWIGPTGNGNLRVSGIS